MSRHVIIVGRYKAYPHDLREGEEIWCVNDTFGQQPNASRAYFLDPLCVFRAGFAEECATFGRPVYTQRVYDEIPNSVEYPIRDVMRALYGDLSDEELENRAYFTSTVAYMVAHALYEGADEITMHRILAMPPSIEYIQQKPCLDFWIGRAVGAGVKVNLSEDSNIARPMPWQSGLYGYIRGDAATEAASQAVTAACQFAARSKLGWVHAADLEARVEEQDDAA